MLIFIQSIKLQLTFACSAGNSAIFKHESFQNLRVQNWMDLNGFWFLFQCRICQSMIVCICWRVFHQFLKTPISPIQWNGLEWYQIFYLPGHCGDWWQPQVRFVPPCNSRKWRHSIGSSHCWLFESDARIVFCWVLLNDYFIIIIIIFHGSMVSSVFLPFWGGVIYWCHALWKRERYEKNQFQDLGPKTDNEICHRIQSINLFGSFWWVEFQHGKICFWMAAVFVFWSEDPIWPTHRSERLALVSALGTSQLRWEKLPGRWHDETIFRLCLFATFYSDWDYTLLYCTNVYLHHLVWGCPSKKDSQYHKNIECYKFHHHIYNTLLTSHQVHV